jgi:hypothetical protein
MGHYLLTKIVTTKYFFSDEDDNDHKEPDGQGSNGGLMSRKDVLHDGKSWQKYDLRWDDEANRCTYCLRFTS